MDLKGSFVVVIDVMEDCCKGQLFELRYTDVCKVKDKSSTQQYMSVANLGLGLGTFPSPI
jgi:hypothetical protein